MGPAPVGPRICIVDDVPFSGIPCIVSLLKVVLEILSFELIMPIGSPVGVVYVNDMDIIPPIIPPIMFPIMVEKV